MNIEDNNQQTDDNNIGIPNDSYLKYPIFKTYFKALIYPPLFLVPIILFATALLENFYGFELMLGIRNLSDLGSFIVIFVGTSFMIIFFGFFLIGIPSALILGTLLVLFRLRRSLILALILSLFPALLTLIGLSSNHMDFLLIDHTMLFLITALFYGITIYFIMPNKTS